jgi:hypothetical protein
MDALRQGIFVGTKPNGFFQKSMQIAHGKQVTHKNGPGQKQPLQKTNPIMNRF